jgi:hypothetical protein
MPVKSYSVDEICAIIKACGDSRVCRLKVGTFSISFIPPKPKTLDPVLPTPSELEEAKEYQSQVFAENERMIRDRNLSELRISDPEAFEELISNGELEDAGKGPNESELG